LNSRVTITALKGTNGSSQSRKHLPRKVTAMLASNTESFDRWNQALLNAPTTGASAATASQDNLPAGLASSHQMAQTDLFKIHSLIQCFRNVGKKYDIPPAFLAALASRESRCGAALDATGFGDGGNAFGIMQVDKRYHDIRGTSNPVSLEHLEQAAEIVVNFREQVKANHLDWEDAFVLKGTAVAYNSGVSNVQTKAGMDLGTTGNDYGSDVIARAQFYTKYV
jgi:soluble lytic murein transglycosylase-like protein